MSRNFADRSPVTFEAVPLPGFIVQWTGACRGKGLSCKVTVHNATHVRAAFRPALSLPVFYFGTNLSNVTMASSQVPVLKRDLITLSHLRVKVLTIRAYADYRNGPSYNYALSQRRADSVTKFIRGLLPQIGITQMQFRNLGFGILRASTVLQLNRKAVATFI